MGYGNQQALLSNIFLILTIWRMLFAFEGVDAVLVDYRDYHW